MNHNHFAFVFALVAIGISYLATGFIVNPALEIVSIKMTNAALLLTTFFGLLKFLKGTSYDVLKEVFEEHNSSAAILLSGLLLALAIAITVNS